MFSEFFAVCLGWLYLKIRYRTTVAMQLALKEKYDGSYSATIGIVAIKIFAVLLIVLIISLLMALVMSLFKFGVK